MHTKRVGAVLHQDVVYLQCFVLETKHFRDGLKITEEGEFLRFNGYTKRYEGMPSPIAQNERPSLV